MKKRLNNSLSVSVCLCDNKNIKHKKQNRNKHYIPTKLYKIQRSSYKFEMR